MLVFKFGGASVKDANGIINLGGVVKKFDSEKLLIVVSAMGKTTNALERLTKAYVDSDDGLQRIFDEIKTYHYNIMEALFEPHHPIYNEVANTFVEIDWVLEDEPHDDYDFIYDQIVSIGELVSTRIVNAYLNLIGIKSHWLDVRGYVQTDNTYREGVVQWDKTCAAVNKDIPPLLENGRVVTQGFLGGTSENFTTTLGREGAESVTTWKDVPGILNADPKLFDDTVKFDELSYAEAIEMTYYGASVIHPKTIKPLQNEKIPLLVKSFTHPDEPGTIIHEKSENKFVKPVIIVKPNQVLLSISPRDYSFISEQQLSSIFKVLSQCQVKVNVMQTSALSFTVCFDLYEERFKKLRQALEAGFKTKFNDNLTLITVRHYSPQTLEELTTGKNILMEQLSRNTIQLVVR
jgi:aspartate kinase